MTHFQLYNVTAQFHGTGGRTHLSTQLGPAACSGDGALTPGLLDRELGTYPEVVAVSALGGGGSSELSMLDLQCLPYICPNYLGVGIVPPMAHQTWPLGTSVYPELSSLDHNQLSHCSFLKHPHCHTPASPSPVQHVDSYSVQCTPRPFRPYNMQAPAPSCLHLALTLRSLNHCVSLFSKW